MTTVPRRQRQLPLLAYRSAAGQCRQRHRVRVRARKDSTGLAALPRADRAAPDCLRGSRCKSESHVGEVFQRPTPALPGARHDPVRSYPGGTWLVVHMPAAAAPPDVEYGSGFDNPNSLSLTVRAEGREGDLPAMRAMKIFHASSLRKRTCDRADFKVFLLRNSRLEKRVPPSLLISQRLGQPSQGGISRAENRQILKIRVSSISWRNLLDRNLDFPRHGVE